MGLGLATKAFFKVLMDSQTASAFQNLLDGKAITEQPQPSPGPPQQEAPKPDPASARSEAISLLAALQRDARLLDIVQESLDDYSDEQVGAAARSVLADTGKVLNRMFDIQPLSSEDEGTAIDTPSVVDPARYRLTGNVTGDAPYHGTLAHHGWQAGRCEVPKWTGNSESVMVIAPIEVDIA